MAVEIGRLVIKIAGRDAGLKGVVINILGGHRVLVTGPKTLTGLRRKPVNLRHLILLPHKVNIERESSDEEVLKALERQNLVEYMRRRAEVRRW